MIFRNLSNFERIVLCIAVPISLDILAAQLGRWFIDAVYEVKRREQLATIRGELVEQENTPASEQENKPAKEILK